MTESKRIGGVLHYRRRCRVCGGYCWTAAAPKGLRQGHASPSDYTCDGCLDEAGVTINLKNQRSKP
jgi:hypothetical protein